MKKVRALVIGCGAIAHNCHLLGYNEDKDCAIVAVADPSPKNRKSAQEKFTIGKAYASVEDMLKNESADCISITSPNAFHAEHAVMAMKKGLHVLCEKPLCVSKKEIMQITSAAKKSGVLFMTAFSNRFYKGTQKAKQQIDAGKIGDPYMIRVRFAHEGPKDWMMSKSFFNPKLAVGGALFDMGIHAIDLAQWLYGPIAKVSAITATLKHPIPMEDNVILQFQFKSGALGYAEAGWTSKQGFAGVEIMGSEAGLVVDYNKNTTTRIVGSVDPAGNRKERIATLEKNALDGGWPAQMKYFLKCIRKGEQPGCGVEAGAAAVRVALAAYESHNKGKIVSL
ncbi:Gfo/Idh/MocA family oxidoreductase [bacterium]|nr:Gfo/Idh/MocA family oxidoreductase [bacterium]